MQPTFKELWTVSIGKERFTLTGKEFVVLRQAMASKERWVSFKRFILSIPHIESIFLEKKEIANQLGEGKEEYTQQDRQKAALKMDKMRKKFFGK